MSIENIWLNKKETGHNFILFHNDILYHRQVKKDDMSSVQMELNQGVISDEFIGLPVSYMKQVVSRAYDKTIKIDFGSDSVDSILIKDDSIRKEVFELLKSKTDSKDRSIRKPSILLRIAKPLGALVFFSGLALLFFTLLYKY